MYIYYITAAGKYGKARRYGAVDHIQNHTCRVTLHHPARRVTVLGQLLTESLAFDLLALPKKTASVGKTAFGLSSIYYTYSSFVLEP
jgi:hypothetical protein